MLNVWAFQRPGTHPFDELPQHILTFQGEGVPLPRLPLIDLHQVLAEDFPCQSGLDFGEALSVQESGLAVGAVADHVDVGVMGLVVEGGVPAELAQRYLHGLRKLRRVTGEQVFPVSGVVVSQACGVLPAQGDNREPHIAGVAGHGLCHLGEYEWIVRPGEQTMSAGAFRPRTFGDVVHIVLTFGKGVRVVLDSSGDELRGVPACGGCEIVLVLKQPPAEGEVTQQLTDLFLLPFSSGQSGFAGVQPVHAFTGGDVADVVLPVGGGAVLIWFEVRTFENEPRHKTSPPCGQHMEGPVCSGFHSGSSG